ncbi:GAF domain-containing protein [Mastigocoleus sp. MO_188.B34]|uniref:GAF domain-containing protein n=1 Tax=Mastigocoleus sp. MO_188.B34 TaxID=3036635 RepID=UPI00261FF8A4|nr:GAF domain-containing protein [Mastigocoleus sp. MO_188.B34]MDJ0697483.1 GAF domain-containing protein [Mastigocoleus sp. MO_188.B34]
MQKNIKQTDILRQITKYIRQNLELQVILTAAAADLRSFLEMDRVKVCKFNPDGSGQVIAESVDDNCLPAMLGLHFPGDEIPAETRELYVKVKVRSIVNVDTKEIAQSAVYDLETTEIVPEEIRYRSVDPCHLEYLTAIGVKSSLVLPIIHDEKLWGLLACHHSEPRVISESDLELVQMVVDQISIAIVQSTLLSQMPEKAARDSSLRHIVTLLHSLSTVELQPALAQAIVAFGGSGGRLCIREKKQSSYPEDFIDCLSSSNYLKVYTYGKQPVMPELAKYKLMEQYSIWQERYKFGNYDDIWAISDIYQVHELRFLQVAFQGSKVRSILMIPLHHRQKLLGYLSIFRNKVEKETVWAGEFDSDQRQLYPRQSLNAWREYNKTPTSQWSAEEIQLANEVGKQFSFAVHEYQLQQDLHKQTNHLQRSIQKQETLVRALTKMRQISQSRF